MIPSVSVNFMTLAHRHTYLLSEQLKLSVHLAFFHCSYLVLFTAVFTNYCRAV